MADKIFLVLVAFLAVQGWTSAAIIPDEFEEFLEYEEFWNFALIIMDDLFSDHKLAFLHGDEIVHRKPANCVPYIPGAYRAAKEAQILIGKAKELSKELNAAAKKCKALTNPEENKSCYQELKKQAVAKGKPIYEAYKQLKPKIAQSMANFDKCMACVGC